MSFIKSMEQMPELECLKQYLVGHNGYIAGGCFKDIFTGKQPKDIDIFFRNIDDLNKATEKTDDCALRGSPDGNGKGMDWISDCDAQDAIYALLTSVVARCSRKPRLPKRHRTPEGCRKRFRQPQALGGKRSVEIPAVRRVRAGPALPVATRAVLRDPDSLHDARVILMRAGDSRR